MNKNESDLLKKSLRKKVLEITYYPNFNPYGTVLQSRHILPLRIYTKRGRQYLLSYFISGGSLSKKGSGYRLYIINNIRTLQISSLFKNVNIKSLKFSAMEDRTFLTKFLRNDFD